MAAKNGPDLAGWPVLRLDQIAEIDSETLKQAGREAVELISTLLEDSKGATEPPKLVYYLNKQVDATKNELARRAASQRVAALLSGITVTDTDNDSLDFLDLTPRTIVVEPKKELSFKPIPLPSEISKSNVHTPILETKINTSRSLPENPSSPVRKEINHKSQLYDDPPKTDTSLDAQLSARSAGDVDEPNRFQEKGANLSRPRRQRPISGKIAADDDEAASRRAVAAMYKSFGNSFVVGAVDRRVRFLPKKAPVETPEEIKERERSDRYHDMLCRDLGC